MTFGANEYKEVTLDADVIYWVDERCVPAEDYESNYGTMRRLLLDEVGMPDEYVYPIYGVNRRRLKQRTIRRWFAARFRFWVASRPSMSFCSVLETTGIPPLSFRGRNICFSSFHPYEVSVNPYNGQKRIAMTGCLLFAAKNLIFFITGKNKADVVRDIL